MAGEGNSAAAARFYLAAAGLLSVVSYCFLRAGLGASVASSFLGAMTITGFVLVAHDKRLAEVGALRVPEILLQLLALLGGSVGVMLAMAVLRHKIRKRSFQVVVVFIFFLQILLIIAVKARHVPVEPGSIRSGTCPSSRAPYDLESQIML